tara:strand:+ start:13315 stop:13677 length:363 start_codon:yes stop_codon:yes gene_type:complete
MVFTNSQVAGVGTGKCRRASGENLSTELHNVPRAVAARDTRGIIKLAAVAGTDRLSGGMLAAPEGHHGVRTFDMARMFGTAIKTLDATVFTRLTTVEGLELAAQTVDMQVVKLSRPQRRR